MPAGGHVSTQKTRQLLMCVGVAPGLTIASPHEAASRHAQRGMRVKHRTRTLQQSSGKNQ